MKRIKLNSIFKIGFLAILVAIAGTACVKSYSGDTDFSKITPTVMIPDGGMQNFSSNAILFPPTDASDTAWFYLNYAAADVAPQDEVITIAFDQNALDAYNALGGNQYAKFPDSIFSFTTTTVTVKKGNNYSAKVPLVIYPDQVDLLENYMFPITITAAPAGSTISSNFKTIYYHLIGNPIAGLYTQEWIRYNNADGSGTPAYDLDLSPGVFAPIDGFNINVQSGTGPIYNLSFADTAGVLSNFQVSFVAGSIPAGLTITGGPTIVTADATTGTYIFNFTYNNSAGSPRNITDKFGK